MVLVWLAVVALIPTGCMALTIAGLIQDSGVTASVTATGDPVRLLMLQTELDHRFGVDTKIKAVRKGACIVEIIGTYMAVVDALHWMALQGIVLIANNVATEGILEVAIACIK
jgi:hypothetical protein